MLDPRVQNWFHGASASFGSSEAQDPTFVGRVPKVAASTLAVTKPWHPPVTSLSRQRTLDSRSG